MITSESPATQSRSFFFGVNATLAGGFGRRASPPASSWASDLGFGVAVVGGTTIATSISSASLPAHRVLDEPAGPVEQEGVADVVEAAGERERDVTLGAGLAVEGGLVHAGRHQQGAEDEREHGDDEPVARRREAPAVLAAGNPRPRGGRGLRRPALALRSAGAGVRRRGASGSGRPAAAERPPAESRTGGSRQLRQALAGRSLASEAEVDEGRDALGAHGIRQHQGEARARRPGRRPAGGRSGPSRRRGTAPGGTASRSRPRSRAARRR